MADNQTPQQYAKKRASEKMFGFKIRNKLFPGEDKFFQKRPEVAGMATEDGLVIINPYSPLSLKEKSAVAQNEALRLKMKKDKFNPKFKVTPEQEEFFKNTEYAGNPTAMRQTILARIYSGDPSAMATEEQKQTLSNYLSNAR
jgi:hypothetical protein